MQVFIFFEEMVKITLGETTGTFYISMKTGRCIVSQGRRKTSSWTRRFFFVKADSASVSDLSRPFRISWNPYHGSL